MATKRKAAAMTAVEDEEPVDPTDELVFVGLGGCQEVGRSCHILQYKGKTVMVCPSGRTTTWTATDHPYSSMLVCIQAEKACPLCHTLTTLISVLSTSSSSASRFHFSFVSCLFVVQVGHTPCLYLHKKFVLGGRNSRAKVWLDNRDGTKGRFG